MSNPEDVRWCLVPFQFIDLDKVALQSLEMDVLFEFIENLHISVDEGIAGSQAFLSKAQAEVRRRHAQDCPELARFFLEEPISDSKGTILN